MPRQFLYSIIWKMNAYIVVSNVVTVLCDFVNCRNIRLTNHTCTGADLEGEGLSLG